MQSAQADAAAHRAAAAAAKLQATQDAARAAALAQQQIAAAAALRQLEDQTAQAAASLADLDNQSASAKQALQQNEAALAALLPVMQRLSSEPAAAMLAVPASPTDAIRGILIVQGIAAEIESRARAVGAQARLVASLQKQKLSEAAALTQAVATQQKAEDALSVQITGAHAAETTDLDTAARAAAATISATRNVQNLQNVIDKLRAQARAAAQTRAAQAAARIKAPPLPANPAPGVNLPEGTGAPVAGRITQSYGAPTLAGPAAGVTYRAAPGATVAALCSGPVLYADNFQSYGLLVIIDCGNNYDFVLSGMRHLDVTAGQKIIRGQPIGEMQGYNANSPAKQPLLYVELRRNGTPVNPAAWLNTGGSG